MGLKSMPLAMQLRGRQSAGGGPRAGRLRVQGGLRRAQVHGVRQGVPRLSEGRPPIVNNLTPSWQ